jgi:hypothetical protein
LWIGLAEQDSLGIRLHVECSNSGPDDSNSAGCVLIVLESEPHAAAAVSKGTRLSTESRPVGRTGVPNTMRAGPLTSCVI